MWNNLTRNFMSQNDDVIIKVDPNWGFSEFPSPGDTKKHLLPILIDPEYVAAPKVDAQKEAVVEAPQNKFWMPDRFCKVCYGCEEAFTMYRRRHHCRMCGQIFCNGCSSFYIDGKLFNTPGLVRACRLCYDQQYDRGDHEYKAPRSKAVATSHVEERRVSTADDPSLHKLVAVAPAASWIAGGHCKVQDVTEVAEQRSSNLQKRASFHLSAIVDRLLSSSSSKVKHAGDWKDLIVHLVGEVVSSVDPDVRAGRDNMDIRPYVKIKVIPGGSIDESVYVDGVVFRKNVSHKKMGANASRTNPRILLIAEGIEFQRADMKLSSMDTLIEQEDKHMELAVEKIMSLKPDIILVGKAIGRKAQELLCGWNVVVMQNVKAHLLERIGRMTGAMLLPSTDHMIKQFGEECLGTCAHFRLSVVHDDPEKKMPNQVRRILETRIARGSTYAYIQGCPSDRGCSIILRGADRATLKEIKRIIAFSVSVAYHLRLEVAYYIDRYASLPALDEPLPYEDGSDADDATVDVPLATSESAEEDASNREPDAAGVVPLIKSRKERQFLSTSLDIDISLPFSKELIGTDLFMHAKSMRNKTSVDSHQTLLVTSLLIGEGPTGAPAQKASADVKGIKYYTKQDIALGQFIIENCFQMTRSVNRDSTMLDQTLSFVHRTGRVDITVHRSDSSPTTTSTSIDEHGHYSGRDPRVLPIFLSSFCKVCKKMVTPPKVMSDETWKMSFGKFLEIQYYNRSARCSIGECTHCIRDDHTLYVQCESYVAEFSFVPIHAYALNVRNAMAFPLDFHMATSVEFLKTLPTKHSILIEDFRLAMGVLEREIRDLMGSRPEDLGLAIADVNMMEAELIQCSVHFLEDLIATLEHIPVSFRSFDADFLPGLVEKLKVLRQAPLQRMASIGGDPMTSTLSMHYLDAPVFSAPAPSDPHATCEVSLPTATAMHGEAFEAYDAHNATQTGLVGRFATAFSAEVGLKFPFSHMRETYLYAVHWNNRMNTIYKFLESVSRVIAANQASALLPTVVEVTDADYDEYLDTKKVLSELVLQDSAANGVTFTMPLPIPPNASAGTGNEAPSAGLHASSPSREVFSGGVNGLGMTVGALEHSQSMHNLLPSAASSTLQHTQSMQNVTLGSHLQHTHSVSNMSTAQVTSLATASQSLKNRQDKPQDKMSRFTKVLQRFLVLGNKEAVTEQHTKFFVPLEELGHGRLGMKPGRRGEVIPVYEDEYATIIAYSLASEEYHQSLQEHLQEVDSQSVGSRGESTEEGNLAYAAPYSGSSNNLAQDAAHSTDAEAHFDEEGDMDFQTGSNTPLSADLPSSAPSPLPNSAADATRPGIAQSLLSGLNKQRIRLDRRANSERPPSGFVERAEVDRAAEIEADKIATRPIISMDRAFANAAAADEAEHSVTAFATGSTLFTPGAGVGVVADSVSSRGNSNIATPEPSRKMSVSEDDSAHVRSKIDQSSQRSQNEKQMVSQDKSYIRHRFDDHDDRGNVVCKFQCQTYWAKQFEAVRACYFKGDERESYLRSLATSKSWATQGGKSGAAFSKSSDDRLVVKCISRVELQMFLEFAPAYFEYMAKAYYHHLPTVLCKILGVYTIRFDNRETGRKAIENVVVMENIFYQRNITRSFDLKGSSRARYVDLGYKVENFDEALARRRLARRFGGEEPAEAEQVSQVLMDDNLMELTKGRPFPLKHRAKLFFHKAVQNDTLFLSIVNVVDYSILVGFDENTHEVVVGIIDYMRQYDIIKKMERMGKSVGMIAGQAEPTIIQPSQYRKRFSLAMERYFMTIPDKWITHES